jgi:hypothetical protein
MILMSTDGVFASTAASCVFPVHIYGTISHLYERAVMPCGRYGVFRSKYTYRECMEEKNTSWDTQVHMKSDGES